MNPQRMPTQTHAVADNTYVAGGKPVDPTLTTASDFDDLGMTHHSEVLRQQSFGDAPSLKDTSGTTSLDPALHHYSESAREMTKGELQKAQGDAKMDEAKQRGLRVTDNEPHNGAEAWEKASEAMSATGQYLAGAATKAAGAVRSAVASITPGDEHRSHESADNIGTLATDKAAAMAAGSHSRPSATGSTIQGPSSTTSFNAVDRVSGGAPTTCGADYPGAVNTYPQEGGVESRRLGHTKGTETGDVADSVPRNKKSSAL